MVSIDIHKLNLEELSGVVDMYPWYGAARVELCSRMRAMNALSEAMVARTALYVGSRKILYGLLAGGEKTDCSDKDAQAIVGGLLSGGADSPGGNYRGVGDYFSLTQYEGVRRADDNIFSKFSYDDRADTCMSPEIEQETDFCTEALAKIYLEQGYPEQAKEIYSKLILRYPEKSIYFASLIEKINSII